MAKRTEFNLEALVRGVQVPVLPVKIPHETTVFYKQLIDYINAKSRAVTQEFINESVNVSKDVSQGDLATAQIGWDGTTDYKQAMVHFQSFEFNTEKFNEFFISARSDPSSVGSIDDFVVLIPSDEDITVTGVTGSYTFTFPDAHLILGSNDGSLAGINSSASVRYKTQTTGADKTISFGSSEDTNDFAAAGFNVNSSWRVSSGLTPPFRVEFSEMLSSGFKLNGVYLKFKAVFLCCGTGYTNLRIFGAR